MSRFRLDRPRIQRRAFNRAVLRLKRTGTDREKEIAETILNDSDFANEMYTAAVGEFVEEKRLISGRDFIRDESGTPILDALLGFFRFLIESGLLEKLIDIFLGVGNETGTQALNDLDDKIALSMLDLDNSMNTGNIA